MKTCPVCDTPYPDKHSNCPTDGAVLIESQEFASGRIVRGKYRIIRKLGQGGMGVVYLAEHMMLGGQMALKFLAVELSRNPQFVKRFRNEARAAYQLRHPNIVEVSDLDQDEEGNLFIAMEYVSGPSLRAMLSKLSAPVPVPRALQIARGIASGLAAAHARGAVHRDIKPENILLATSASGDVQAKVLDFGIAAMTDNITNLSHTHGLLLTPEYAAPEQWRGTPATELDGRTDLYALGGILYEMLTGRTPFRAANVEGWMYQHLQGVPENILTLRPELGTQYPGLDSVVMSLLARDRDQRLPSAAAFLDLLPPPTIAQAGDRAADGRPLEATGAFPRESTSGSFRIGATTSPGIASVSSSMSASSLEAPRTESISGRVDTGGMFSSATPEESKFNGKLIGIVTGGIAVVLLITIIAIRGFSKSGDHERAAVASPVAGVPSIVADPVISPPSGKYGARQIVTIFDPTPYSEIHFTLDGTAPSKASKLYTQPIGDLPNATTIKAIAFANGMSPSHLVVGAYQFGENTQQQSEDVSMTTFKQGKASYDHRRYGDAREQFSRSCDSGSADACNYLGYLYAQGLGGTRNLDEARMVYQEACAHGNMASCASLGAIYRDEGDEANAKTYLEKACNGGLAEGCNLLHSLH